MGSKFNFIKEFVNNKMKYDNHLFLVLNGYHPGTIFKTILNSLTTHLKERKQTQVKLKFFSIKDQIDYIHTLFSNDSGELDFDQLVIVVNSLDKSNMRNEDFQGYLSYLCKHPRITLVAGVDDLKT